MYFLDDLTDFKDEIIKLVNQSTPKETCAAFK